MPTATSSFHFTLTPNVGKNSEKSSKTKCGIPQVEVLLWVLLFWKVYIRSQNQFVTLPLGKILCSLTIFFSSKVPHKVLLHVWHLCVCIWLTCQFKAKSHLLRLSLGLRILIHLFWILWHFGFGNNLEK